VILPLLYFAFRSPWLVAVGAVPSALSVLVVMAAYAWLGIPLSAAAAGAAAMQFGLGIDGVVLLFVAYRHVGRVVSDDGGDDLSGPTLSMLLGMWTTAATFYGLAVVDFPSLEELGLLIGHSMMVCGARAGARAGAAAGDAASVSTLTTGWLPRLVVAGALIWASRPRSPSQQPSPRRACASIVARSAARASPAASRAG
jgi:hypothetical protein